MNNAEIVFPHEPPTPRPRRTAEARQAQRLYIREKEEGDTGRAANCLAQDFALVNAPFSRAIQEAEERSREREGKWQRGLNSFKRFFV